MWAAIVYRLPLMGRKRTMGVPIGTLNGVMLLSADGNNSENPAGCFEHSSPRAQLRRMQDARPTTDADPRGSGAGWDHPRGLRRAPRRRSRGLCVPRGALPAKGAARAGASIKGYRARGVRRRAPAGCQ